MWPALVASSPHRARGTPDRRRRASLPRAVIVGLAMLVGACATNDAAVTAPNSDAMLAPPLRALAPPLAARLRALDCGNLTTADVHEVLARVPAPRIVLLDGSVPVVTMASFARLLAAMGYPEMRLRDPRNGELSTSSFTSSAMLAGELAFDYEHTGLSPMLIGHSQGGMLVIRTLDELAGEFGDALHVVDPSTGRVLSRTWIVDPYTHTRRPVVGLRVAYAAALATGWLPRLVLGQWTMLSRLRTIPDTVDEFTGFTLPHDPIAGNLFGDRPYVAAGHARVRNVTLPDGYHHVALPAADHLARDPAMRAYLDAWRPDRTEALPPGDTTNLVHAADIWYSVKRHWCGQAQRLLAVPAS
jgi:hypothetical protein